MKRRTHQRQPTWWKKAFALGARVVLNFLRHDMSIYAALAYRGLVAVFPFVIFVLALAHVAPVGRPFAWLLHQARSGPPGRVPTSIKDWLIGQLQERPDGAALVVGGFAAVWAVAASLRVLRTALNAAGDMPETKSLWRRVGFSLVVAPALGLAATVALALLVVTSRSLASTAGWIEWDAAAVVVWDWLRIPAGVALLVVALAAVYRFAPDEHRSIRAVVPGAVCAACAWALASAVFSFALSTAWHYGVTYGSFSAAIVMLVYLYLSATILLLGAEVNAAFDREHVATVDQHPHA